MIKSKNPYTGELIQEFKELTKPEIDKALQKADDRFKSWRKTSFKERADLMHKAAKELKWKREYSFEGLVEDMLNFELSLYK